jgi:hypothetical protein
MHRDEAKLATNRSKTFTPLYSQSHLPQSITATLPSGTSGAPLGYLFGVNTTSASNPTSEHTDWDCSVSCRFLSYSSEASPRLFQEKLEPDADAHTISLPIATSLVSSSPSESEIALNLF